MSRAIESKLIVARNLLHLHDVDASRPHQPDVLRRLEPRLIDRDIGDVGATRPVLREVLVLAGDQARREVRVDVEDVRHIGQEVTRRHIYDRDLRLANNVDTAGVAD